MEFLRLDDLGCTEGIVQLYCDGVCGVILVPPAMLRFRMPQDNAHVYTCTSVAVKDCCVAELTTCSFRLTKPKMTTSLPCKRPVARRKLKYCNSYLALFPNENQDRYGLLEKRVLRDSYAVKDHTTILLVLLRCTSHAPCSALSDNLTLK